MPTIDAPHLNQHLYALRLLFQVLLRTPTSSDLHLSHHPHAEVQLLHTLLPTPTVRVRHLAQVHLQALYAFSLLSTNQIPHLNQHPQVQLDQLPPASQLWGAGKYKVASMASNTRHHTSHTGIHHRLILTTNTNPQNCMAGQRWAHRMRNTTLYLKLANLDLDQRVPPMDSCLTSILRGSFIRLVSHLIQILAPVDTRRRPLTKASQCLDRN
jgi:hypothetical protein